MQTFVIDARLDGFPEVDFGDEWRVSLKVRSIEAADAGSYPRILAREGQAPPQYPDYEDEEELIEVE